MSKAATYDLNKIELLKLNRAFSQSISIENKSARETVSLHMIRTLIGGRRRTKLGKKRRQVVKNPEFERGSGKPRFAVKQLRQNKPPLFLPKKVKTAGSDPRVLISNRGLAKSSWGWALSRLGKARGKNYARGRGRKFVRLRKSLLSVNPRIVTKIALTYILKMHPTIVKASQRAATNFILKRQEQKLAKKLQKRFRR